MFEVIEVTGKIETLVGRYAARADADRICDEMVSAAGKARLMLGYFIQKARKGR